MAEQEPNRRDKLYASEDHEVEYFRGMLEKHLRRMREAQFSDSLAELAPALAKAQAEFSTPKRTKEAMVTATRSYKYADLQDVLNSVREPLAKHGLSITQMTQEYAGQLELVTLLLHSSGQWLRSVYPVKARVEKPQEFGSAMTYARRYTLSALLGIASEDDDDAQGAQDSQKASAQPQKPKPSQRAPQPSGDPMIIMSPATGENEEEFPRTQGGARDFLEALEIRCNSDTSYWKLHRQEAVMVAEKLPDLNVNGESASRMVDRMDAEFGGTIDPDDVDAGKQGPKQVGKVL